MSVRRVRGYCTLRLGSERRPRVSMHHRGITAEAMILAAQHSPKIRPSCDDIVVWNFPGDYPDYLVSRRKRWGPVNPVALFLFSLSLSFRRCRWWRGRRRRRFLARAHAPTCAECVSFRPMTTVVVVVVVTIVIAWRWTCGVSTRERAGLILEFRRDRYASCRWPPAVGPNFGSASAEVPSFSRLCYEGVNRVVS